ncbi:unnamed protein product [Symbiodinium sp. KB8]|nr:unnamed protein product [Symbiodinium sp. KB8]
MLGSPPSSMLLRVLQLLQQRTSRSALSSPTSSRWACRTLDWIAWRSCFRLSERFLAKWKFETLLA